VAARRERPGVPGDRGERSPTFETWDRIGKLYGWPQTFVGTSVNPRPAID
jgi:hypothetical protein